MKKLLVLVSVILLSVGCSPNNPRPKKEQQSAQDAFEFGKLYYEKGKFDSALKKFTDAVDTEPNHIDANLGCGNSWRELGTSHLANKDRKKGDDDHHNALYYFQNVQRISPNNKDAYYGTALLYFERATVKAAIFSVEEREKYVRLAIDNFNDVLKLDPSNSEIYKYLGLSHSALLSLKGKDTDGNAKKAISYLTTYRKFAESELNRWRNSAPTSEAQKSAKEDMVYRWQSKVSEITMLIGELLKAINEK